MSTTKGTPGVATPPRAPVPATPVATNGHVHIDIRKLSLHGYNASQQRRFMQALQTALWHHASERGDWSSLASRHLAQFPPLQARSGMSPEDAAKKLARQIFDRLDQRDAEQADV